jgi:hypothetical protein
VHVHLEQLGAARVDQPGEAMAQDAVHLAGVGDGVLAGGGLAAGGAREGDEPVGPVAAPDLPR